MSTIEELLRANGIVANPVDVVAAANEARLSVAINAAKLQRESYGGRNVFGGDKVPTGNTYRYGDVVTRDNCQAYLRWRRAGKGRQQGVGPSQLTYFSFQDDAEARGGLHVPRINMLVGAAEMARCLRVGGSIRDAGAIYNSGKKYSDAPKAAKEYGDWLAKRTEWWEAILRGVKVDGAAPASAARLPTLKLGMRGSRSVASLQNFSNKFPWKPACVVVKVDGDYGPATQQMVRENQQRMGITGPDADGSIVGPRTNAGYARLGYSG